MINKVDARLAGNISKNKCISLSHLATELLHYPALLPPLECKKKKEKVSC